MAYNIVKYITYTVLYHIYISMSYRLIGTTVARLSSADVNNSQVYNHKGKLVPYNTDIIYMDRMNELMKHIPERFPDAKMNSRYVTRY